MQRGGRPSLLRNEIRKELGEGGLERRGNVEEVGEEMVVVGKRIGVLDVRREAVVGVGEGDLEKANTVVEVWRERERDEVDIEWGGDEGNGVSCVVAVLVVVQLQICRTWRAKSKKGIIRPFGYEREHHCVLVSPRHVYNTRLLIPIDEGVRMNRPS